MINLVLQSAKKQFYCNVWHLLILSALDIAKRDSLLLPSMPCQALQRLTDYNTKCVSCYKMKQFLTSETTELAHKSCNQEVNGPKLYLENVRKLIQLLCSLGFF